MLCPHQVIIGLASFKKKTTALLVKESDAFGQEGVGEESGGVSVQIQIQTVKEAQVGLSYPFALSFPIISNVISAPAAVNIDVIQHNNANEMKAT